MLQRTLEYPLKLMPDVWDIIASSDDPPTQIIVKVEAADAALRESMSQLGLNKTLVRFDYVYLT